MGYIKNEYVIAHIPRYGKGRGYAIEMIEKLRMSSEFADSLIAGPLHTPVNGDNITYFFGPDGSKEGWPQSDEGDKVREQFIESARNSEYAEIVHLQMGGDDGETKILGSWDYEEEA
mgnify:CR=1 FL=1|jgi:hypothetical protein